MKTQFLLITILGLLFCNYCFTQQAKITLKEKMRLVDNTRKNSYLDSYVDSVLNSYYESIYIFVVNDILSRDSIKINDSIDSAINISFLKVMFYTGETWVVQSIGDVSKKQKKQSMYRELQLREQIWIRKEIPYEMINKYNLGLLIFDDRNRLLSAEYEVKPVGDDFEIIKRKIESLNDKDAEIQRQKLNKARGI